MEYFQSEVSESNQRQLARILHRQSIIYEGEKNGIMCSAFTAAARDALAQITGGDSASTLVLSQQIFDKLVDPWYR